MSPLSAMPTCKTSVSSIYGAADPILSTMPGMLRSGSNRRFSTPCSADFWTMCGRHEAGRARPNMLRSGLRIRMRGTQAACVSGSGQGGRCDAETGQQDRSQKVFGTRRCGKHRGICPMCTGFGAGRSLPNRSSAGRVPDRTGRGAARRPGTFWALEL